MKIAVIGSGAVGTVLAYELNKSLDVTLLGRSEKAMTVKIDGSSSWMNVTSLMLCDKVFDLIFVCVKTTRLNETLPHIKRLMHEKTTIILCENGMGQIDTISLPNCYQAVVYISGQKKGNIVTHFQDKTLIVPDNNVTRSIAAAINTTQIEMICDHSYEEKLWYKLLVNLGINTVTALSKNTAHILQLQQMRNLVYSLLSEGVTVAGSYDMPFNEQTIHEIMAIYDTYPAHMGTSMYYDVLNSEPTEYEFIQGAVKRFAEAKKIDTPVLDVCLTLLQGYQFSKE